MIEESIVVLTQHRGGLRKPTSRQDRIDGDFVADTNPKPLEPRGNSPAGLIELVDQTVTNGGLKCLIGRFAVLPQSRHRAAYRAAADSQTISPRPNRRASIRATAQPP